MAFEIDATEVTRALSQRERNLPSAVTRALETVQKRTFRLAQGTTGFTSRRPHGLRSTIRQGKTFFDSRTGYGQTSILAGARRLRGQATAVEFGVRRQGTFHTQRVPGFGARGLMPILAPAVAHANRGNKILQEEGKVLGRFLQGGR